MREYFEKVWVIAKVFKRPLLKMFIALAVLSIASVFAPYAFARIIESMTEGLEMLCIVFIVVIGLITILDNLAMYYKSYIEINYYSFDLGEDADLIEQAVENVLAGGLRTADIMQPGKAKVSTSVMGESLIRELDKLSA